jgi:hypothetical protein
MSKSKLLINPAADCKCESLIRCNVEPDQSSQSIFHVLWDIVLAKDFYMFSLKED